MEDGATTPGAVIRKFRIDAGLTLKAVAANAGTSIAYLSKVERGEFVASREYVARVLHFITGYELARMRRAA